ncbi:hypothetical protein GKE56_09480 [Nostocoides sp. HKS02]|nr:hypothetical protein GKE56_09480 [Tetrasphaera sp. HKS02]
MSDRGGTMGSMDVPPGPWHWQQVIPQTAPGSAPETAPRGMALVASDGTWILSAESGWGSPDVHPAAKSVLARAWVLRPPDELGGYAFDADLNVEDDFGNNWSLLERSEFDPTVIYPGAVLWAGRTGAAAEVEVLRTELFLARGDVLVLVTFRQTAIRSREEALDGS